MDNTIDPAIGIFAERRPRRFPWLNVALFVMTCLTTLVMGAYLMASFNAIGTTPVDPFTAIWRNPAIVWSGLPFSIAIMTILFAHEMGHYLTCRYYGIDASLPYFIPMPISPVGTMGAFIRIRAPIHNRAALLDVGIAGPIAGFVFAVPALIIAMTKSRFVALDPSGPHFGLGEPLVFKIVARFMGQVPPAGMDLYLHPIGFAAWFGFLATALNLLPVGQLDGGHVSYSLFGSRHRHISQALIVALVPLGIFYWPGWLFWSAVLLFIGLRHPVTLDDSIPLKQRHIWLGWIALVLLALCFTPIPFYIN